MILPLRYQSVKYEDVPQQIRDLFESIPTTRRGIYIHGAVGTGKTHIAYAIASKCKRPVVFWNTTELLNAMRSDFDANPMDKDHPEDLIMNYDGLVVLDDVGSEKMTDWVSETFYRIINHRYMHMRPTIFTSNLPISDLADRIGDRTVSRIVEMSDVVELVGKDRRVTEKPRTKVNLP